MKFEEVFMIGNNGLELLISAMSVGIIVVLAGVICFIVRNLKENNISKTNFIITSILSVIIVLVSWFFNFGYLRLFLTAALIPFVHAFAFFVINLLTADFLLKSERLKKISLLFCLTYLLAYLLLPDGVDVTMYLFFGFIKSNAVAKISNLISLALFIGNIVLFFLQTIELNRIKRMI